jgi:hypothetical protein
LLQYRNSVHTSSKHSPSELVHGRSVRMNAVGATEITFNRGNEYREHSGISLGPCGNRMMKILDLDDGSVHTRHIDQVALRFPDTSFTPVAEESLSLPHPRSDIHQPSTAPPQELLPASPDLTGVSDLTTAPPVLPETTGQTLSPNSPRILRRSSRATRGRPPERLEVGSA